MGYDNEVVLDAEWTSIPKRWNASGHLSQETIEIGAVRIASDGKRDDDTFTRLVKPTLTMKVSWRVSQMTGIGNEDIALARPLDYVLRELVEWIGPGRTRISTWGSCDLAQISRECAFKDIGWDLPTRWLNLQRIYPRLMGTNHKRCVGLEEAAEWCGLDFNRSAAHRALYDAKVTAKLFKYMASGDCLVQRKALDDTVRNKESMPCATSVGALYGSALETLLGKLRDEEAAFAFA